MKIKIKLLLIVFIFLSANILLADSTEKIKATNIIGKKISGQLEKINFKNKKKTVINFFSIKCKPCKKELPELAKIEKEYPDIKFYAVHLGLKKEKEIQNFLSKLSAYPKNILIAGDILKEKYRIFGLPFTAIIDSEGFITHRLQGYIKPEVFKQALNQLK
jgi:thiol-disulfide isomerase/thioredoxin